MGKSGNEMGIYSQYVAAVSARTRIIEFEETNVTFVEELSLREAQEFVSACENCAENALISFDYLLDAVTGCDPAVTEYLMCRVARCPGCRNEITEKTRIVSR